MPLFNRTLPLFVHTCTRQKVLMNARNMTQILCLGLCKAFFQLLFLCLLHLQDLLLRCTLPLYACTEQLLLAWREWPACCGLHYCQALSLLGTCEGFRHIYSPKPKFKTSTLNLFAGHLLTSCMPLVRNGVFWLHEQQYAQRCLEGCECLVQ